MSIFVLKKHQVDRGFVLSDSFDANIFIVRFDISFLILTGQFNIVGKV